MASQLHVIIADDDHIMRRLSTAQIEQLGHRVTSFEDGDEVVAYLLDQQGQADYVILDHQMRRMDGIETLEVLRAHPTTQALPIFLLTGSSRQSHQEAAAKHGVTGYLIKPVRPDILHDIFTPVENR